MTRPRYTLSRSDASAGRGAARRQKGWQIGLSWVGAGAVVGVGLLSWPYTVDDAYIVARYATHLARGLGYAMNPGTPSDGVTGPLWVLPQAFAVSAGLDPIDSAKLLGLACIALAVFALLRRLQARALGAVTAPCAAVLIALSPSLGTAAVSGLETGLATALLTFAALAVVRRPRVQGWQLGGCVAALAWLRPELALASGVLLLCALLRDRRAGAIACALALAGAASVIAWRLVLFDDWLPLSVRAKPGTLAYGARYTWDALWLATSLIGVWLGVLGVRNGAFAERVFAAAVGAHLLAVTLAGGDWMPGYRLVVPVLPLYAWLAARGLARGLRRPRLRAGCLALACLVPAADLVTRVPDLRATGANRRDLAELVERLRTGTRVVAMVDVGYLAYASGVEVVDLGGLTDPVIARAPGGHLEKRLARAYIEQRAPDALLLHSRVEPLVYEGQLLYFNGYPVERQLAAMPFVAERFRVAFVHRYDWGYLYVLLTARSGT